MSPRVRPNNYDVRGKTCGDMILLYLPTLLFHKIFILIFLKRSFWHKTMYLRIGNFLVKFSYTFSVLILRSTNEQRLLEHATVFPIKNKLQPVILTFYFDLLRPFYFLKWNRFFWTFIPVPNESCHYLKYLLPGEAFTSLQTKKFPLMKF